MASKALSFDPPLFNSASLWASTEEELRALYLSPHTGAVTTRTALLNGFAHDESIHRHVFFDAGEDGCTNAPSRSLELHQTSSLNTLGYSPFSLSSYIVTIRSIEAEAKSTTPPSVLKPVIFSVTGTATEVRECLRLLSTQRPAVETLAEINLSCPNIPNAPPPAYSPASLATYLEVVKECVTVDPSIAVGLKLPPYTHAGQFKDLVDGLERLGTPCPVSFLTSTNTLGSCLSLDQNGRPTIGIGGLAGASLHPLALGNVATLRRMLNERPALRDISIVGVGGVSGPRSYANMRAAGAEAVAVATALGRDGVEVFKSILGVE